MTNDERDALNELKRVVKEKIRIGATVYGIIELYNGRLAPPTEPEPDPEPLDDEGVPFKNFDQELNANGWIAEHIPPISWQVENKCPPQPRGDK